MDRKSTSTPTTTPSGKTCGSCCSRKVGAVNPASSTCNNANTKSQSQSKSSMAAGKLISLEFEVYGKVQGVFFRKYTQSQGKLLGLRGWCENTPKGTVVGALQGPADKIKIMKEWLQKTGSPKSNIVRTDFRNEKSISDYTFTGFEIIRK